MTNSRANLSREGNQQKLWALLCASLLASPLVGGCYETNVCGEEVCNLRDDDCDGEADEGIVDEDGAYRSIENCGGCGIDCTRAFPTAERVGCVNSDEGPICRILECPAGQHFAGSGACEPDVPVLCLTCSDDVDCAVRWPGARCLETESGARRCGQPCDVMTPCPRGFLCEPGTMELPGQCVPESGLCGCNAGTEGVELACILPSPIPGMQCAGVQRCGVDGPSECEPALEEACNAQDDDCDGSIDETFRDAEGRYVARLHCGGCARPCVEPGPNMVAMCLPEGAGTRCDIACLEGFVDVDRILANGCECERWTGEGPPPVIGGDADCDGTPDNTTDFIYVTPTGSDTNPGSLEQPLRTIQAGIARAEAESKDVVIARGIYEGPFDLRAGVSLFGGYSPDFSDRDLELYPVLLERMDGEGGLPVVRCSNIRATTRVEGFQVQGSDATRAGVGSTTIVTDGCGPEVSFVALTVFAGRGGDGLRGDDASVNLADWGLSSLTALDGERGTTGSDGNTDGEACRRVAAGVGGTHSCRAVDVSGGNGGASQCPGSICTNGAPCGNAGCTDFTSGGRCDIAAATRVAEANPAAGAGRGPGAGAAGELTYNAPTNRGVCNFCDDNPTLPREGGNGGDGTLGIPGAGGAGCMLRPTFDADGRLRAGDGGNAGPGTDGGGGGGGTAGGGYEVIGATMGTCSDRSGGSGGGGGSGGCGAPGADAGTGGGESIGILVRLGALDRGPTFTLVRVVTASGGVGGDGGVGAAGGIGGTGAGGGVGRFWCARTGGRGGDGGRGGAGGGGGGGCGGGTHGVYLTATGPIDAYRDALTMALTIEATGVAGRGGRGGFSPGNSGTDGVDGSADPIFVSF